MTSRPKFTDIEFGYRSADAERRNNPELLDKGFFNKDDTVQSLLAGQDYIVLGYKGSGKSAIAEHLDLIARDDPDLFVEVAHLSEFPFEQVPQLIPGNEDSSHRASLAWSLVLLIKLFESVCADEGFTDRPVKLKRIEKELQGLGLLPRRGLKELVLRGRELNLSATLPNLFEGSIKDTYSETSVGLSHVRDELRNLVANAATDGRHLLVIDGLDEIFYGFAANYAVLAALVHEIDRLNAAFAEADACAKIIVLFRTDLFERLPSPNVNKLRDFAVLLDWYHSPGRPTDARLLALATHRARLAGYSGPDVLMDYLPPTVRQREEAVPASSYLLEHTRHTPRDFLQLLHYVQQETTRDVPDFRALQAGLRSYSVDYFLPEMKDELSGYLSADHIDELLRLLGGLRQREFVLEELEQYARESRLDEDIDLREAIRILFDCSAVGNIVYRPRRGRRDGTFYTFRYRNRNASVNYRERLVFHRGAWKALNLV